MGTKAGRTCHGHAAVIGVVEGNVEHFGLSGKGFGSHDDRIGRVTAGAADSVDKASDAVVAEIDLAVLLIVWKAC